MKYHKALPKTQIPLMIRNLMRQKNHSGCLMNSFCNRRIQNYVYIWMPYFEKQIQSWIDWVTQVNNLAIPWSKQTLKNFFRTKKIKNTPALQVSVWSIERLWLLFRIILKIEVNRALWFPHPCEVNTPVRWEESSIVKIHPKVLCFIKYLLVELITFW